MKTPQIFKMEKPGRLLNNRISTVIHYLEEEQTNFRKNSVTNTLVIYISEIRKTT